jgi:hypothetical protein
MRSSRIAHGVYFVVAIDPEGNQHSAHADGASGCEVF